MNSKITVTAVSMVLLASGAFAQSGAESMVGKTFPSFSLKSFDGKTVNNQSMKGKVTVVDFWASWCGPCKQITPVLQKIHTEMGPKGVLVLGANTSDKAADAMSYIAKGKYSFTNMLASDKLASELKVTGLPTVMVVDKNGKITKVFVGYSQAFEGQLRTAINNAL